ncbi:hypothetical protein [Streptomyces hesseae]|uniref:Uncharacterized protein n=1 Tax=Streptomyces hesseae TaxID=3075519 RepID=A0ABU2SXK2_9ACTN|nr:hypothetical protein [Streptomyces sp. DSM 40473]MDT0453733.1 hypothetical protein [Streptomyces sp. DSM 40473]
MTSTYQWPRGASSEDFAALEQWLAGHCWEVDPTVFMAGARGPAVQVRRIGADWRYGEPGLLILPGETVQYDGARMCIAPRPIAASKSDA